MVVGQKLDSRTFDDLLRKQNPFGMADPVFDLRQVQLVTPAAMVQLAAGCHALAHCGRIAAVRLGENGVRSYLLRGGFIAAIQDVAKVLPPVLGENLFMAN